MENRYEDIIKNHFASWGESPDHAENFAFWARDSKEQTVRDIESGSLTQLVDDITYSARQDEEIAAALESGELVGLCLGFGAKDYIATHRDELLEALTTAE